MKISKQGRGQIGSVLLSALALSGCVCLPSLDDDEAAAPEGTECTDPRPQICTMEYLPVCASLNDGSQRTYASGCSACADPEVQRYVAEECP